MKNSKVSIDYSMVSTFVIIVICIIYNIYSACYTKGMVSGQSMYPTLYNGEKIYTTKIIKYTLGIKRGDIVTTTVTVNGKKEDIVKRVIGLPNERVTLKNGVIRINGGKLIEPYLDSSVFTDGEMDYILGEDEYILLGDNRSESFDSRFPEIGKVKLKDIHSTLVKRTEE